MSLKPLDPIDLLARFKFNKPSKTLEDVRTRSIWLLRQGKQPEAARHASEALLQGTERHDRNLQTYAFAYLAVVYTKQEDWGKAAGYAEDCHRLSKQLRSQHNTAIARALLAMIYQKHLEKLSDEFAEPIQEVRAEFGSLTSKALAHGLVAEAQKNQAYMVEFGDQARRARWIPAVPHALPLVWLPVIDRIAPDLEERRAEPIGYMEPLLFVLKSVEEAEQEALHDIDAGPIVDQIYTARPLPPVHGAEPDRPLPPRLKPDAIYAAVKVDPDTAYVAHLEPDDYLLVRSFTPEEREKLAGQSNDSFRFQMNERGLVEVVKPIPPKFVGEDVTLLEVKVDAVLRRVPS